LNDAVFYFVNGVQVGRGSAAQRLALAQIGDLDFLLGVIRISVSTGCKMLYPSLNDVIGMDAALAVDARLRDRNTLC
jgi:hypothetical protein